MRIPFTLNRIKNRIFHRNEPDAWLWFCSALDEKLAGYRLHASYVFSLVNNESRLRTRKILFFPNYRNRLHSIIFMRVYVYKTHRIWRPNIRTVDWHDITKSIRVWASNRIRIAKENLLPISDYREKYNCQTLSENANRRPYRMIGFRDQTHIEHDQGRSDNQ